MILNKKTIALIQKGITIKSLDGLNESQVDKLYSVLFNEQVATTPRTGVINVKKADTSLGKELAKAGFNVRLEAETEEQKNPWAICTAQMGKEFGTTERSEWNKNQRNKYERCVKDVKKSLKEGKEPFHYFVENELALFAESKLPSTINKGELQKLIEGLK